MPAQEQLDTLVELIKDLSGSGTVDRNFKVMGHNEVSVTPTACPGRHMRDKLKNVRSKTERHG